MRVRAAIKKRRKAGFLFVVRAGAFWRARRGIFARCGGSRCAALAGAFRSVKSGKSVCACNLPIKAAAVFYILCIWCVRFFKINFCFI